MEKQEREPVWVPIHKLLGKVPGGRIIIPLIIGSIIVTICDACGVKDPWGQVGSPSLYLFSSKGITIVLGFMLFFTGTQIDVRKMKSMLGRGFPLLVLRLGIAYGLSFLFFFLTKDYDYMWIGISFVTFTSCLTSTNAGMFMGLVNPYGDDADYSYFGLLLLTALPAFPMLLIQGSTSGGIDYMSIQTRKRCRYSIFGIPIWICYQAWNSCSNDSSRIVFNRLLVHIGCSSQHVDGKICFEETRLYLYGLLCHGRCCIIYS